MNAQFEAIRIETYLKAVYSEGGPDADDIRKNPYKYIEDALKQYSHEWPNKRIAIEEFQSKYRGLINNSMEELIKTDDADNMITELGILLRPE